MFTYDSITKTSKFKGFGGIHGVHESLGADCPLACRRTGGWVRSYRASGEFQPHHTSGRTHVRTSHLLPVHQSWARLKAFPSHSWCLSLIIFPSSGVFVNYPDEKKKKGQLITVILYVAPVIDEAQLFSSRRVTKW